MRRIVPLLSVLLLGCHSAHEEVGDDVDVGEERQDAFDVDGGGVVEVPVAETEPLPSLVASLGNPSIGVALPEGLEAAPEAPEGPVAEPEVPPAEEPPSEPMTFEGRVWSVVSIPTSKASTFGSNQKPCEGVQLPVLNETWTVSVAHGELFVARKGRSHLTGWMKLPHVYKLGNSDSYGLPIDGVQRWTITMDASGFSGPAWVWLPEIGCGGDYEVSGRPQ